MSIHRSLVAGLAFAALTTSWGQAAPPARRAPSVPEIDTDKLFATGQSSDQREPGGQRDHRDVEGADLVFRVPIDVRRFDPRITQIKVMCFTSAPGAPASTTNGRGEARVALVHGGYSGVIAVGLRRTEASAFAAYVCQAYSIAGDQTYLLGEGPYGAAPGTPRKAGTAGRVP